jgi:hypothetical protein
MLNFRLKSVFLNRKISLSSRQSLGIRFFNNDVNNEKSNDIVPQVDNRIIIFNIFIYLYV